MGQNVFKVWLFNWLQSFVKLFSTDYFVYGKPCEDDLSLPIVPQDQTRVPYIIDAVYAVALGLHNHITKHCNDSSLCESARCVDSIPQCTILEFPSIICWCIPSNSGVSSPKLNCRNVVNMLCWIVVFHNMDPPNMYLSFCKGAINTLL